MIKAEKSHSYLKGFFLLSVMLFYIANARVCSAFLREGLRLCAYTLAPALFPHLVLSELALPCLAGIGGGFFGGACAKALHVRRAFLPALLCGSFCGAPIGARTVASLAKTGVGGRREVSVLAAYANHTSPAFIIGGVGLGLFHSAPLGVLIFTAELLSSLLCLALFMRLLGEKDVAATESAPLSMPTVSLSDALSHSVGAMLSISAVVLFFSPVVGFIRYYLGKSAMPFVLLLEVTNACADAARMPCGIYLAVFAVSFGGVSVALQSLRFLKEMHGSLSIFLFCKSVSAFLSLAILFLLTRLPLF